MSSSSTQVSTAQGPGSVSDAPNLPAGFTDTFASRYIQAGDVRLHAVVDAELMTIPFSDECCPGFARKIARSGLAALAPEPHRTTG